MGAVSAQVLKKLRHDHLMPSFMRRPLCLNTGASIYESKAKFKSNYCQDLHAIILLFMMDDKVKLD